MIEKIFSLDHISFNYPAGPPVVEDLTIEISSGERVALLGDNAAGKSTLLRILDGLIFATSGSVQAFGKDLNEQNLDGSTFGRFFRQQVAFLFQNVDSQLFCATVKEELEFGPRHLGMKQADIERRVDDLLEMFDLCEISQRSPQTLSGGEKRRLGLAAVLAVGPSVVLLDEPTSSLDSRSRGFLVDVLTQLSESGKTLIFATHDDELVQKLATRSVVLKAKP